MTAGTGGTCFSGFYLGYGGDLIGAEGLRKGMGGAGKSTIKAGEIYRTGEEARRKDGYKIGTT